MNAPKLIGPAGALADLFARTVEDAEVSRLKLLFTGQPGIGKTELANQIARNLTGDAGRFAIESVNGRKLSVHVVSDWQRLCATSCMFGTGWRAFIVNECDTAPSDAQDLLLTFLDELPPCCAFIATSNLDTANLTPRLPLAHQQDFPPWHGRSVVRLEHAGDGRRLGIARSADRGPRRRPQRDPLPCRGETLTPNQT